MNQKFARVEQVKKFRLIEQQLTAEDEELTPTMKLKRKLVQREVPRPDRGDVCAGGGLMPSGTDEDPGMATTVRDVRP